MQIGVVDASNKVIGRAKLKTKADKGGDVVVDRMVDGIEEACEKAGLKASEIAGLGVGAPGAIDMHAGIVLEAPNLRWNNMPLADRLKKVIGNHPVLIDNDVNVAVYGENKLGAGQNSTDVLGVWIGTGIGGGLILNGRLYYGAFGSAGEIGQTILFPGAPLGSRTLEQTCSRKHLVGRAMRLIEANNPSILSDMAGDSGDIGASGVAEAYRKGDDLVRRLVDESAEYLGLAIANFVTVLSLPIVILGGGMAEAFGQSFADQVAMAMKPHVFPKSLNCRVVTTALADDAGLLGAALLARERFC